MRLFSLLCKKFHEIEPLGKDQKLLFTYLLIIFFLFSNLTVIRQTPLLPIFIYIIFEFQFEWFQSTSGTLIYLHSLACKKSYYIMHDFYNFTRCWFQFQFTSELQCELFHTILSSVYNQAWYFPILVQIFITKVSFSGKQNPTGSCNTK